MSNYHIPVLLQEVLEGLQIQEGAKYIDATLGGGGHTAEIVKYGGKVLGIDADEDALKFVTERIKNSSFVKTSKDKQELGIKGENVTVVGGNFKDVDRLAKENGFEQVSGILFDLGVSSFQLEKAEKGFSFMHDGPLDMRMDKTLSVCAVDLVNGLTRSELVELFWKLGEERNAKKIAQKIEIERQFTKIETTNDLVRVIEKAYGVTNEVLSVKRRAQIAMRVFQALRIAVNDELHVLEQALPKALELLAPEGRLVVISFHSLEDRIVKETFVAFQRKNLGKIITKKPIIATENEGKENRRSRSAKLRIFEKG